MFWAWIPGALFTCIVINCRSRKALSTFLHCVAKSLQYSFFGSNICLMWLVECRCPTSSVMQLRRLLPSKDSVENHEVIFSSPQTILSRDLTVAAETMPQGPFSVILISQYFFQNLIFFTACGNVFGGGDCPFLHVLCTEKAAFKVPMK